VLVEESTDSIQLLKESALEKLLAATLIVTGAALTLLLVFRGPPRFAAFAPCTAEAEAAIDPQGRITGSIAPSTAADEIGDLSRTMAAVMERCARTTPTSRHGRAPVARAAHARGRRPLVVDNLQSHGFACRKARFYCRAARAEGVDRLAAVISRLSEGTRLRAPGSKAPSASASTCRPSSPVCVEGYRAAYREHRSSSACRDPCGITGVPDAFRAAPSTSSSRTPVDFAPRRARSAWRSRRAGGAPCLSVENDGPPLPEAMVEEGADRTLMVARLFDSMVTLRDARSAAAAGGVHLGLGLFIVRLVAEFHGGHASAHNLSSGQGVRFAVEVPIAPQNP
jgi:hypothetical protein